MIIIRRNQFGGLEAIQEFPDSGEILKGTAATPAEEAALVEEWRKAAVNCGFGFKNEAVKLTKERWEK